MLAPVVQQCVVYRRLCAGMSEFLSDRSNRNGKCVTCVVCCVTCVRMCDMRDALYILHSALVAVHCTHGLNRTGYLVCRYTVSSLFQSAVYISSVMHV